MNQTAKELLKESRHGFDSLVRVMELLRLPGGCPWDREQTHESIRANFIEETYEVIEAIDTADPVLLREELGDVLLQVVFHARISEEAGDFRIDDVIHDVTEKLIRRHPHIFADVEAETSEEVLANWEQIKTEEKQRIGLAGSLASVPPSLPALMRAQKLMKKAAKAGIRPDSAALARAISDTSAALADALIKGDAAAVALLSGHLSFLTAAAAQISGADTEEQLSGECKRFEAVLTNGEAEIGEVSTFTEQQCRDLAQNAYLLH
jgi:tetrapyrrole methylase family protein/MazG family protein